MTARRQESAQWPARAGRGPERSARGRVTDRQAALGRMDCEAVEGQHETAGRSAWQPPLESHTQHCALASVRRVYTIAVRARVTAQCHLQVTGLNVSSY